MSTNNSDRSVRSNQVSTTSSIIIRCTNNVKNDLTTRAVQPIKNCSINGLPDLLPVAPRPPPPPPPPVSTNLPTTGYILVPASAVGFQSINPTTITNLRLFPAGTIQQATAGTIVVVGTSTAKAHQISTAAASNPDSSKSSNDTTSKSISNDKACNAETSSLGGSIVDEASLQLSMCRNRESLKRKLLQRRSVRELVDQGILPPPKTPPSYYEQRIKLERAKMSDILKHKIEHRPDKQQLVSQHILLDSCADPGILEKQQQLKKCKLADSLNEKLANRPGPLELVQENILHVDAALEQAIKDGRLQFKPTSAGLIQKRPQPVFVVAHDVASSNLATNHDTFDCSDLGFDTSSTLNHSAFSQSTVTTTSVAVPTSNATELNAVGTLAARTKPKKTKTKARIAGSGSATISKNCANNGQSSKLSKLIRLSDSRKTTAVENRTNGNTPALGINANSASAGFVNCNGLVGDRSNSSQSLVSLFDDRSAQQQETSYDLLLQQQQLLLQWQYELQQKYPNSTVQLVSLSSTKPAEQQQQQFSINFSPSTAADNNSVISSVQSSPGSFGVNASNGGFGAGSSPQTPAPVARSESDCCTNSSGQMAVSKTIKRLEDMKVNDLKTECKKRNLPVSGSKSNIVERLKPFEEVILANLQHTAIGQQQRQQLEAGCSEAVTTSPLSQNGNPSPNGQRAALPPISFLCANSGAHNTFSSSAAASPGNNTGYGQHNGRNSIAQASSGFEAGHSYGNRSSSCSDFTSNYSSPGVDLSVLNFGNGTTCAGEDEMHMAIDSSSATTTTEQYTFSTPNFGAQFLVTSNASGISCNGESNGTVQACYDEHAAVMDTSDNGHHRAVTVFQHASQLGSDGSKSNGSVPTPPLQSNTQQYEQQPQRLPFLQAANTLTVHEEVLRQQQKKIEEIQKELQRSQELLRQQQQMILAAKQIQTDANESGMSDADCILSQLDTKQIQKAHIQLFLQQKIQQQQLQQQINVQQELMEIQQKLQEEMTIHQALNEVVRLLRQEPRVSILVLHLLRRHQIEQQQRQQQQQTHQNQSTPALPAGPQKTQTGQLSDSSNDNAEGKKQEGTKLSAAKRAEMQQQQKAPQQMLVQMPNSQCNPKLAPSPTAAYSNGSSSMSQSNIEQQMSTDGVSNSTVACKNRQVNGQGSTSKKTVVSLQSPLARANSVPTSPVKAKSSSSMGDMEEIFRSVLDYATKATEKVASEQHQNAGALPSFEQLLPRPVSEIETAITIANGSGILMTSAHDQQQQLSVLDHLPNTTAIDVSHFTNANDMSSVCSSTGATADCGAVNARTQSAATFTYSRNEAFDDLMEVLRNNETSLLGDKNETGVNAINSCPSSLTSIHEDKESIESSPIKSYQSGALVSQAHQQLNLLSAFGAQEVADLLGTEWFNVDSLLPHPNTGHNSNDTLAVTQGPDLNAFGVSVLSSGRAESGSSITRGDERSANNNSLVLVSSDMSDQMDWLDLILPSPSSAGGNGVLHDLPVMNCLPMDTDNVGADRGDNILLNGNACDDFGAGHGSMMTSTHNPVLAMSACVSGEAL